MNQNTIIHNFRRDQCSTWGIYIVLFILLIIIVVIRYFIQFS
jgi:hypothetical protein